MDVVLLDIVKGRVNSQTQQEFGEEARKRLAKVAPPYVY